jgi:hypothetical protein
MNKLHIASNFNLPAEFAGRRTAIFGISGSGKSNTATVFVEQLLSAGEQVVLIDPKGEGWGLLSLANGKPSNLPLIVFGEPNGHIETLNESHGQLLADFVVESGRSVVLSLLGFESDQSERRFVATFLRQLYRRKSRQGHPTRTLVVIDEAHLFVPENIRGDAAELAGAVQRIVRQGRSFGIGTLLIDQRPQDVSKRVVTQCDTLICHQLVHKLDRDALREWVRGYDVDGRGEQFLESLARLEPGEAWIWSPAWLKLFQRTKIHQRRTFDSGAAPDGSVAARSAQRANVDLDALRGQLAEIVEKAKADDPKELKRQIAELRRQIQQQPKSAPPAEPKIVEVPVITDQQIAEMTKVLKAFEEGRHGIAYSLEVFMKVGTEWQKAIDHIQNRRASNESPKIYRHPRSSSGPVSGNGPPAKHAHKAQPNSAVETKSIPAMDDEMITGPEQRILDALAWCESIGINEPEQTAVAFLAGYTIGGGAWNNPRGRLRVRGFIDYLSGDRLKLTEAGRVHATAPDSPLTTEAMHKAVMDRLPGPERKLLQVLLDIYPDSIENDELARRAGYEPGGGAFNNPRGRLRSLGIVEYPERGKVAARGVLFVG